MVNVARELLKELNKEETKIIYVSPDFEVICNDDLNDNTPRLSLGQIMNTRLGICFKFKDKMYTYELIDPSFGIDMDEVKKRVKLLDIRRYDESIVKMETDQLVVVRILETEDDSYLSEVLNISGVNVDSWVVRGLEKVFSRMHSLYLSNSDIREDNPQVFDLY